MDMYIEVNDGVIHGHPILADNLGYLGLDLHNLPSNYVKYIRDDHSISPTNVKSGQWLEYIKEYNPELGVVFEYALVLGNPDSDANHIPPALQTN
jgi:hypothetical protein